MQVLADLAQAPRAVVTLLRDMSSLDGAVRYAPACTAAAAAQEPPPLLTCCRHAVPVCLHCWCAHLSKKSMLTQSSPLLLK